MQYVRPKCLYPPTRLQGNTIGTHLQPASRHVTLVPEQFSRNVSLTSRADGQGYDSPSTDSRHGLCDDLKPILDPKRLWIESRRQTYVLRLLNTGTPFYPHDQPLPEIFHVFLQSLQVNVSIVP
jgi:hypothetical protein